MPTCLSVFGWGASRSATSSQSDVTLTGEDGIYGDDKKVAFDDAAPVATGVGVGAFTATDTTARIAALRSRLDAENIDLYLVPSEDAHGSEYTAPRDQRRSFISGFTGSAGVAIVGNTSSGFAGLWADGRYHFQAEQQLDDNWTLFKVGVPKVLSWDQWLVKDAFEKLGKDTLRLGVDSRLLPFATAKGLLASAKANGNTIEAVFEEKNLVTDVWTDPELPFKDHYPPALDEPVHEHPLKFAGQEAQKKIATVVEWLGGASIDDLIEGKDGEKVQAKASKRGDYYVVDALDEIAWLLNLRGASIPNNRKRKAL